MCSVWKWAMSEEVRDQLGMDYDWRYKGAQLVAQYCRTKHIPLEKANVTMDQTGKLVLVGNLFAGYPVGEFGEWRDPKSDIPNT